MSQYKSIQIQRKSWLELNRLSCQAREADNIILFTSRGPNDPPLSVVEFEFKRPLKEINDLKVKVDFKQTNRSKPPSWSGVWKEVKYEIIDSVKAHDAFSKLRLKFTSMPWGEREKQQFVWFSFKFNDDDSQIYVSPETKIQSSKTFDRQKDKSREGLRESIITDRDAILNIPLDLKGKKLFDRLSDKDWKGNIIAHAIHRSKEENTERAIQLLSSNSLKKDQRKVILMNVNDFGGNILHAAATKGNLNFLEQFKKLYKLWGLTDDDIKFLLSFRDEHNAIPYEMAIFQESKRGKDMYDVLRFILGWMDELQLDHFVETLISIYGEPARVSHYPAPAIASLYEAPLAILPSLLPE